MKDAMWRKQKLNTSDFFHMIIFNCYTKVFISLNIKIKHFNNSIIIEKSNKMIQFLKNMLDKIVNYLNEFL